MSLASAPVGDGSKTLSETEVVRPRCVNGEDDVIARMKSRLLVSASRNARQLQEEAVKVVCAEPKIGPDNGMRDTVSQTLAAAGPPRGCKNRLNRDGIQLGHAYSVGELFLSEPVFDVHTRSVVPEALDTGMVIRLRRRGSTLKSPLDGQPIPLVPR